MHILNDFFLLTWNQKESFSVAFDEAATLRLSHNYTHDTERFCDSAAITLIIHPENLEAIGKLESLNQILNNLFSTLAFTKENIQKAQKTLLHFLIEQGNLGVNQAITHRLERLRKEEIISYDVARRLMSFISLIEEKKERPVPMSAVLSDDKKVSFDYYESVNALILLGERLLPLLEDEVLEQRVGSTLHRMRNATFSIGVTGVMNAGKSTLLNAFLGKELLGTAVVPETANLTVIAYAKEPYALVNFWNASEWTAIEKSASRLSGMEAFIAESKGHFGSDLERWIDTIGRCERIALEDLGAYTSVKASDKKCNLVKSVEVYTDVALLENGVLIVDTPGLDDPVVQREEITLAYLNTCDVLIHLMNASQAATQKDVDFIIDALLYRKVAQLLIVITRIDAISDTALEEVIAYTKKSIHARLKEHNKASLLDEIIAKLSFIPVSAQLALWHKIGRGEEALARGYSLEKTGMPHFETYVHALLFGEQSAKASITVASNRKELKHIAHTTHQTLLQSLSLLSLSQEEISVRFDAYHNEKNAIQEALERFTTALVQTQEALHDYVKTLYIFANNKIDALGNVLYKRIMDDVVYELSKHKRLPQEARIAYMVDAGLKEGMLDLIRDYRYEFQKKIEKALEDLSVRYAVFESQESPITFDAKGFCEEYFSKTMIFKNSAAVVSQINHAIARDAKKEKGRLDQKIEALLKEELALRKETLSHTLAFLNEKILKDFSERINAPIVETKAQMQRKEKMLSDARERLMCHHHDEEAQKNALQKRLKTVETVLKALDDGRSV